MFRRFERKLLAVGGTLNMTASLFMLTALLVNVFLDCKVSLASMSDPIYKLIHFSPVRFSPPTAGAETTSCTPTTTTSPGATPRASSLSSPPPSQPGPISRCDRDGQIKYLLFLPGNVTRQREGTQEPVNTVHAVSRLRPTRCESS